ncbi:MAG: Rpn family recombination-promoting nuclease/putative transposase, partial [Lachnospiraceae bacterium]
MSKTLQNLTLKSNFMFGAVMSDPENSKPLLEMILGFPINKIEVCQERSIVYHPKYHGVRLDVYAKDDNNTRYNVEMQATREIDLGKRSRYYHSQLDMELLTSGTEYAKLPEVFVIFICDFDPFGKNKYCYHLQNCCIEDRDIGIQDGQHTVYLSTKGKNSSEVAPELISFLNYIGSDLEHSQIPSSDPFVKQLQNAVQKVKESREMEDRYMLFELMLQDEHKKGMQEQASQQILDFLGDL